MRNSDLRVAARRLVAELRRWGLSYQQIAPWLGVTRQRAHQIRAKQERLESELTRAMRGSVAYAGRQRDVTMAHFRQRHAGRDNSS
jgi:hypothetical protein